MNMAVYNKSNDSRLPYTKFNENKQQLESNDNLLINDSKSLSSNDNELSIETLTQNLHKTKEQIDNCINRTTTAYFRKQSDIISFS